MSDCCNNKENDKTEVKSTPRKFSCPVNEKLYVTVEKKTILQHLKSPWDKSLDEDKYYFCDDADCDVVYFGLKGSLFHKSELRTIVGTKEIDEDALVCYCFGISKYLATQNSEMKKFVTLQTKQHNCACEIRNPSGRCCLKDFPKNH